MDVRCNNYSCAILKYFEAVHKQDLVMLCLCVSMYVSYDKRHICIFHTTAMSQWQMHWYRVSWKPDLSIPLKDVEYVSILWRLLSKCWVKTKLRLKRLLRGNQAEKKALFFRLGGNREKACINFKAQRSQSRYFGCCNHLSFPPHSAVFSRGHATLHLAV